MSPVLRRLAWCRVTGAAVLAMLARGTPAARSIVRATTPRQESGGARGSLVSHQLAGSPDDAPGSPEEQQEVGGCQDSRFPVSSVSPSKIA